MNSYLVLPSDATGHRVRTASVVVCGDQQRIAETLDVQSLRGSAVEILSSAPQIREYADHHAAPDLCLVVTPLPDGPALPLIRVLRGRGWSRIVVLSGKADARSVHAAVAAGVRSVVVNQDAVAAKPSPSAGDVKLSEREREVLRMVADGQTNSVVGEHLGLSGLTVKSHLARIARKLGCGDRAAMVAEAIRAGYID